MTSAVRDTYARPADLRRGYTLLEMLLTLAVLAVVAGSSWPLLLRAQQDLRLRQAAQDVRRVVFTSRVNAIETGVIWQFLYEPGGRRYLSLPVESEPESDGMPVTKTAAELPEGLQFLPADDQPIDVLQLPADLLLGLPARDGWAGAQWAQPISFLADGSSRNAAFRIIDQKSQSVPLSIRGLTGSVSIGTVRREAAP